MTTVATFDNVEQLERVLAMGAEDRMRRALGQIAGVSR
jgi:hypothetical protein